MSDCTPGKAAKKNDRESTVTGAVWVDPAGGKNDSWPGDAAGHGVPRECVKNACGGVRYANKRVEIFNLKKKIYISPAR
jgi:hypothetical protein